MAIQQPVTSRSPLTASNGSSATTPPTAPRHRPFPCLLAPGLTTCPHTVIRWTDPAERIYPRAHATREAAGSDHVTPPNCNITLHPSQTNENQVIDHVGFIAPNLLRPLAGVIRTETADASMALDHALRPLAGMMRTPLVDFNVTAVVVRYDPSQG